MEEKEQKCAHCGKPITKETGVCIITTKGEKYIHFAHYTNPRLEEHKTRSRGEIPLRK